MGRYICNNIDIPEFDDYRDWLISQVADRSHRDYISVLSHLFEREFTWILPMDENRATDGIGLRYEWLTFVGDSDFEELESVFGRTPCSVLEFLIALSVNWEHEITYDFKKGDRSVEWFWLMLSNLGLLDYPDYDYNKEDVDEIVDIFLERSYEKNGEGGIFPLKTSTIDQTKCEIWIQLQNYLLENW